MSIDFRDPHRAQAEIGGGPDRGTAIDATLGQIRGGAMKETS